MNPTDHPLPREVPDGWHFIGNGPCLAGDKYWRPSDRVWLPVILGDMKIGASVADADMPVLIRRNRSD
jgi:hypothetical protein